MKFEIESHTTVDKSFMITGGFGGIILNVDYDDVWHPEVDAWAEWIVFRLNQALEAGDGPDIPEWDDYDED